MPSSPKKSAVLHSLLCKTCGLIFLGAGLLKLSLAQHEFVQLLIQTGAPLPQVIAWAVPLLEIIGGLALCLNRATRPFASLLALDILAALVLVGLPGLQGQSQHVGPYSIGNEPWRFPLEAVLLVAMVRVIFGKPQDQSLKRE